MSEVSSWGTLEGIKLLKIALCALVSGLIITGCSLESHRHTAKDIIKITDFELSPDEEKVAFSAMAPVGNLDIWVIDIDGKGLKKLTFQDHSPTNHIARFFKKHHWADYFEIDMCSPKWTDNGRIAFCQELTKYEMWGPRTISRRFRTIKPDGTDKRPQVESDRVIKEKPSANIKVLLRNGNLWILKDGEVTPERLI